MPRTLRNIATFHSALERYIMRYVLFAFLLVGPAFFPAASQACTAVFVTDGENVLVGNNEDFWNYDTKMWIVPREEDKYGCIFFAHDFAYAQGGMNEKGLFFDGFATAPNPLKNNKGKKLFPGNIVDHIMRTCESVHEAVKILEEHNMYFLETAMFMFGDRFGNSVIYEGDDYILNEGGNQVLTNFYQSKAKPEKIQCPRFKIAKHMLDEPHYATEDFVRKVMAAVSSEEKSATQYTFICDLKNCMVYLYHFHNFENVRVFDLAEELEKGEARYDIPDLFPKTFAFEMFKYHRDKDMKEEVDKRLDRDFDTALFTEYTGEYLPHDEALSGSVCRVVQEEDELFVTYEGESDTMQLYPEKRDRFFHVNHYGTTEFTFTRTEDGAIDSIIREFLGSRYEFFRKR